MFGRSNPKASLAMPDDSPTPSTSISSQLQAHHAAKETAIPKNAFQFAAQQAGHRRCPIADKHKHARSQSQRVSQPHTCEPACSAMLCWLACLMRNFPSLHRHAHSNVRLDPYVHALCSISTGITSHPLYPGQRGRRRKVFIPHPERKKKEKRRKKKAHAAVHKVARTASPVSLQLHSRIRETPTTGASNIMPRSLSITDHKYGVLRGSFRSALLTPVAKVPRQNQRYVLQVLVPRNAGWLPNASKLLHRDNFSARTLQVAHIAVWCGTSLNETCSRPWITRYGQRTLPSAVTVPVILSHLSRFT
ncbi:hypothetical protein V8C37DRAFT_137562 [Trichoderma ceciliae]